MTRLHYGAFKAFLWGVIVGVVLLVALDALYGCARDPRADQVAKCQYRAQLSREAGQPIFAAAWTREAKRAALGLGCRDNMDANGRITRD